MLSTEPTPSARKSYWMLFKTTQVLQLHKILSHLFLVSPVICVKSPSDSSNGEFNQQHQCPGTVLPVAGNIWKPNFMPMKELQTVLF